MKRFENQVAIVTGAGRGIGEAIARRLAEEGARIAVVSRTEANARKTAEAISAIAPDVAKPYAVDVADFDAVQKTGEMILADFGRCDVLVNNAGITRDTLIMRMSSEDWDVVVDIARRGKFSSSTNAITSENKKPSGCLQSRRPGETASIGLTNRRNGLSWAERRGAYKAESPDREKRFLGDPWNLIRLKPAEGAEMSSKFAVLILSRDRSRSGLCFLAGRRGLRCKERFRTENECTE